MRRGYVSIRPEVYVPFKQRSVELGASMSSLLEGLLADLPEVQRRSRRG